MNLKSNTQPDSAERLAQSRADVADWLKHDSVPQGTANVASMMPERAARTLLAATAARRPWALIASAVAAGGVLAMMQSRRWGVRPSLLVSLAAPLATEIAYGWMQQVLRSKPGPTSVEDPDIVASRHFGPP